MRPFELMKSVKFALMAVFLMTASEHEASAADCAGCSSAAPEPHEVRIALDKGGEKGAFKSVTAVFSGGGSCGLNDFFFAKLEPGQTYTVKVTAVFEDEEPDSCPADSVALVFGCPLRASSQTLSFYRNRYPDHETKLEIVVTIQLPPEITNKNANSAGSKSFITQTAPRTVFSPAGNDLSIAGEPAAAKAAIPLGYVAAGDSLGAGAVSFSYLFGQSTFGTSTFDLASVFLDSDDPETSVYWASSEVPGNPRIAVAPQAVARVTLSEGATVASVEIFTRSAYHEDGTFGAAPIALYEYRLDISAQKLTMKEWSGGDPLSGDPTRIQTFQAEGSSLTVETDGIREETSEIIGNLDSDPVETTTDPRRLFRTLVRSRFDHGKCVAVTQEDYRFIPVHTIDSTDEEISMEIKSFDEVLVSRCRDATLPASGGNVIEGPLETWSYYGQEADLPAGYERLAGKLKIMVEVGGNWTLYGYDQDGSQSVTYSPWLDTPAPDAGQMALVDENTGSVSVGGNALIQKPFKMTVVRKEIGTDTTSTESKTYYVGQEGKLYVGRQIENSDLSTGTEGPKVNFDDRGAGTHVKTLRGTWQAGSGNAWLEFVEGGEHPPHAMTITTHGVNASFAGTLAYGDGLYVLPGRSTQEIVISGGDGMLLKETRILPQTAAVASSAPENAFEPATREEYRYDARGRQTQTLRDGRLVSSKEYVSRFLTRETDESGIEKLTRVDVLGRVVEVTTSAGGGVGQIVQSTVYDGLESRTTVNGMPVSRSLVDLLGRPVEQENQAGGLIRWIYENNVTTQILPTGASIVTTKHFDGRTLSLTGNGTVNRYYSYTLEADPEEYPSSSGEPEIRYFHVVTESFGFPASRRYQKSVYSWDRTLLKIIMPSADGSGEIVVETSGEYQATTLLNSQYVGPGTAEGVNSSAEGAAGALGMQTLSGKRMGPAGGGTRLLRTDQTYIKQDGFWWLQTAKTKGMEDASSTQVEYSLIRLWRGQGETEISRSADGEETTTTTVFSPADKSITVTSTSNRSNLPAINLKVNGYLQWAEDARGSRTTYLYDGFGRPFSTVDDRSGTTLAHYNAAGQVDKTTDALNRDTYCTYVPPGTFGAGLIQTIVRPDDATTTYTYSALGKLASIGGTSQHPESYTYNIYGDKETIRTRYTNASGVESDAVTGWAYNGAGLATYKFFGLSNTVIPDTSVAGYIPPAGTLKYSYDPYGRLKSRSVTGDASKTVAYTWNSFDEMTEIKYGADDAPDVVISRNAAGLENSVVEHFEAADGTDVATGTTEYTYRNGRPDQVRYPAGHPFLPGVTLDYHDPDGFGRPAGYVASVDGTPQQTVGYGYDAVGRLATVEGTTGGKFTYGYNQRGVKRYTRPGLRPVGYGVLVNRQVDVMGRIESFSTSTTSLPIGLIASASYGYDDGDRRNSVIRDDGRWEYTYNERGELETADRYSGDLAIAGFRREYTYDASGNRRTEKSGASGALSESEYEANALNQYTSVESPGKAWLVGLAPTNQDVFINGAATGRTDNWFSKELQGSNAEGPARLPFEVKDGQGHAKVQGNLPVPAGAVNPDYDLAGNLLNDGKWQYKWDAENRLREMTPTAAAVAAGFPSRTIEFFYDWNGRRIAKKVKEGSATVTEKRYLYEGWNVVMEWTAAGNTLGTAQKYLWGLDLAGQASGDVYQLQAAGGVGGLLAVGETFPAYDGNGNIIAWFQAWAKLQSRDYDPFGNLVFKRNEDVSPSYLEQVDTIPYGFSTKPEDKESGLLYYGYRYYNPVTGRWSSRDPIAEGDRSNLYVMGGNNPVCAIDYLGMFTSTAPYDAVEDAKRLNLSLPVFTSPSAPPTPVFPFVWADWSLGFNGASVEAIQQCVQCPNGTDGMWKEGNFVMGYTFEGGLTLGAPPIKRAGFEFFLGLRGYFNITGSFGVQAFYDPCLGVYGGGFTAGMSGRLGIGGGGYVAYKSHFFGVQAFAELYASATNVASIDSNGMLTDRISPSYGGMYGARAALGIPGLEFEWSQSFKAQGTTRSFPIYDFSQLIKP